MSGDLRALAEQFISLTGQIETVRRAMLAALSNGAGPEPRPTLPARSKLGGRPKASSKASSSSSSKAPKAIAAAAAESEIMEIVRAKPGVRTAQIARATGAKGPTVTARIARLRERGLIEGGGPAGFTATA